MRIVSLLPSATEIVCILGLQDNLVGVSHECNFPESVSGLPVVTKSLIPKGLHSKEIDSFVRKELTTKQALYSLNMEVLEKLKPDIIVTQALCEVCAVSESDIQSAVCRLPGDPIVLNLEPMCLEDVFDTLHLVADATDKVRETAIIIQNLKDRVSRIIERSLKIPYESKKTVSFLEWIDPLFNAGHWTPELVEYAGGIDDLGNKHKPSQTIQWNDIVASNSDVLFIACCGFNEQRTLKDLPILVQKTEWSDLKCVTNNNVYIANGNAYFSSPGPRLVDSLEILANTLHPDVHSLPPHLQQPIAYRV